MSVLVPTTCYAKWSQRIYSDQCYSNPLESLVLHQSKKKTHYVSMTTLFPFLTANIPPIYVRLAFTANCVCQHQPCTHSFTHYPLCEWRFWLATLVVKILFITLCCFHDSGKAWCKALVRLSDHSRKLFSSVNTTSQKPGCKARR